LYLEQYFDVALHAKTVASLSDIIDIDICIFTRILLPSPSQSRKLTTLPIRNIPFINNAFTITPTPPRYALLPPERPDIPHSTQRHQLPASPHSPRYAINEAQLQFSNSPHTHDPSFSHAQAY
jgi:hypothetical protein